jgi:predicted alpha/beta hydrolase
MTASREQLPLPHPSGLLPPLNLWPAADPRATVVLIIPALGSPAGAYRRLAECFQRSGLHAAVVELRGVGQSPLRASAQVDWGYADLVDDELQTALRVLHQRLPDGPVVLLGHSLGGHLALLHRARHKPQLAAIVLVAAGAPYHRVYRRSDRYGVWALGRITQLSVALMGWFPGHWIGFGGRQPKRLMREWAAFVRTGQLRLQGQSEPNPLAMSGEAPPIHAVVLPGDRYAPLASTQHLLKLAGANSANIRSLGGPCPTGHFAWLKEPRMVVEAVSAALLRG